MRVVEDPLVASARIHCDRRGRGIGWSWSSTSCGNDVAADVVESQLKCDCPGLLKIRDSRNLSMNLDPTERALVGSMRAGLSGRGTRVRDVFVEESSSRRMKGSSTPRLIPAPWAQGAFSTGFCVFGAFSSVSTEC